ncbi:hypothetical protein QE152_g29231 [Popillia japonica]|uniref:Uncharacterized protein n=1 Tax=Popillia japonica TaxID=7064 RepID=A0AAW1JJP9_POPJA
MENQRQNEHVAALAKTGQDVCGQLQTPPDLPRSMPDLYYDIAGMNFTPQDGPNVDNVRNDQLLWEDNCLPPQQLETTTATLHTIPQLAPVITPHQRDRTHLPTIPQLAPVITPHQRDRTLTNKRLALKRLGQKRKQPLTRQPRRLSPSTSATCNNINYPQLTVTASKAHTPISSRILHTLLTAHHHTISSRILHTLLTAHQPTIPPTINISDTATQTSPLPIQSQRDANNIDASLTLMNCIDELFPKHI